MNDKSVNTILLIALIGAAVFFLAHGYQTDRENMFGQVCVAARGTLSRVGNPCVRPEWLGVGAAFGVAAFLLWRARFKGN